MTDQERREACVEAIKRAVRLERMVDELQALRAKAMDEAMALWVELPERQRPSLTHARDDLTPLPRDAR